MFRRLRGPCYRQVAHPETTTPRQASKALSLRQLRQAQVGPAGLCCSGQHILVLISPPALRPTATPPRAGFPYLSSCSLRPRSTTRRLSPGLPLRPISPTRPRSQAIATPARQLSITPRRRRLAACKTHNLRNSHMHRPPAASTTRLTATHCTHYNTAAPAPKTTWRFRPPTWHARQITP